MEPNALFEDDTLLVINKPAGLLVHADGSGNTTLADWLLRTYPNLERVGEPQQLKDGTIAARPGIVHRLDRETSGVMVVAKTQESFLHLKSQFQERAVEKHYRAFVYGYVKKDTEVIDRPIGRSRKDFRLFSAQRLAKGELREAITHYEVLGRRTDSTYLDLRPFTGRTHQIRVHLKAVNHPVVCDRLYAPNHSPLLGFSRLALHSFSITFQTSDGGERTVMAPLPEDFEQALRDYPFEGVGVSG